MHLIARLVWHATEGRRHKGWRRRLALIRRLAAAPRAEFEAWQRDALREHLRWAAETIPYFRERTPGASELAAFPILTRADLQQHVEALRDPTRPKSEMREEASGGSTGRPVRLYTDAAFWSWECATEAFLHEWWGVRPWSRMAVLWGEDPADDEIHWKQRIVDRALGRRYLDVFHLDEGGMDRFLDTLRRFRPVVLQGYASALELCAVHAMKRGGPGFRPQVIRSAAETLFPERRARIEEAFGQPVFDVYGSRESPSMAAESPDRRLHVLGHGRVIELVDDDGRAVPPGEPGRVLVTDLTNRAFGLIRYENGDVGAWAPPEAAAGDCPFPVLERILGRTSDFITTPEGLRIHGEWFTHLFYGRDDVTRFQVHQTSLEQLEVLTEGMADGEAMAPVLDRIRERLGPGVHVTWRAVDEIPSTATGKHRYTVSDVPYLGASR